MSLFHQPEHADNPPETWKVVKAGDRCWHLTDKDERGVLEYHTRKRDAEAAKVSGWAVTLYEKEGRWYAGENIPGWRPYAELDPRKAGA